MYRIKILIFLFTIALVGGVFGGCWWLYSRILNHDDMVKAEIKKESRDKKSPPDPGLRRFDQAIETIQTGSDAEGKTQLFDMVRHFPDSKRAPEAKRIIGEMNMDALFSASGNTARKDHVVQPGESLNLIARKNFTTVSAIMRGNGMMSSGLQPGDHLFLFPLDFEMIVNVTRKTLTLKRNGQFFKEYPILELKLPSGVKAKPAYEHPPADIDVADRAAWFAGKRVQETDPHFMSSDKWLMTSRAGLNIRGVPLPKAAGDSKTVIVQPHSTGKAPTSSSNNKKNGRASQHSPASHGGKHSQPKGVVMPETSVDDEDDADASAAAPQTGIYLAREDIEELYTIIRTKTKIALWR